MAFFTNPTRSGLALFITAMLDCGGPEFSSASTSQLDRPDGSADAQSHDAAHQSQDSSSGEDVGTPDAYSDTSSEEASIEASAQDVSQDTSHDVEQEASYDAPNDTLDDGSGGAAGSDAGDAGDADADGAPPVDAAPPQPVCDRNDGFWTDPPVPVPYQPFTWHLDVRGSDFVCIALRVGCEGTPLQRVDLECDSEGCRKSGELTCQPGPVTLVLLAHVKEPNNCACDGIGGDGCLNPWVSEQGEKRASCQFDIPSY